MITWGIRTNIKNLKSTNKVNKNICYKAYKAEVLICMISLMFKVKNNFDISPNEFIGIHKDYNFKGSCCAFGNLSKTNIFIGENNSGKSRFLRELFASDFYYMSDQNFKVFFKTNKSRILNNSYETIPQSNIEKFNKIYEKFSLGQTNFLNHEFFKQIQGNSKICNISNKFYIPILRGTKDYKTIINNKLQNFLEKDSRSIQNKDSINHYISLLNLENNGLSSFDIYSDIIKHEYFNNNKFVNNNITTGGELYQEIKSMLLGEEVQRKLIDDFQIFLQRNFFNEYDRVQLIPNEKKKVLYVKIGNDERAIYDWGDGTQQLIIMMYYLFKYKDNENKIFFIEEPEMYLHPGILRKFIEVINSDLFKNHQYFITTHSNIILDVSADTNINMSIFKFKKVKNKEKNNGKDFLIEQCNNGDMSLLNELGVRNSSLFLSNCSIWIEGITDRLYLKHYLKLYCEKYKDKKEYRENLDYIFIEYGGSNMIHFNFDKKDMQENINARYINNSIFLIADNDNTTRSPKKVKRKEILKEQLGENFYELKACEIENLITLDILKSVLKTQNSKQEEQIETVFLKAKSFEKKKLGKYIDNLCVDIEIKKYADESGTIKNKLKFCNSVIEVTTNFDMLSNEAKILTEKIYSFIAKNNEI